MNDNNHDAGYFIAFIKKELDKTKNNDIKEYNITHIQFQVIMFLHHNEDKMIFQKDIEAELNVSKATASGIIDRLEMNGFIRRTPLETDSRYKYLTLCPKAFEFTDDILSKCRKNEERLFNGFEEKERKEAIGYLERMLNNLKENK